jgi:multiple sugar transport system substrate-binding protein
MKRPAPSLERRAFLSLLGGSLLTACGAVPAAQPTAPPTTPTPLPVTLRLGTNDSGEALRPFEPVLEGFSRQYPWITVQIESAGLASYYDDLLAQIENNTAPDVVQIGEEKLPRFAATNSLANLTAYLNSPHVPLDPAIYFGGVFRPGQWQNEPYLLPKDFSTLGVFYNQRLFDAAGLPYPQMGWTWDDLRRVAGALTDGARGQYGIQLPANWVRGFEYWVNAAGGKLISDDGTQIVGQLNGAGTLAALRYYTELYTSGVAAPPTDVDRLETPRDDFVQGKAAMRFYGRWPQAGMLATPALEGALAVVAPPVGQQAANVIAWAGFGITAGSTQKDAAWLLVRYLGGIDGSREWANWGLPAVRAVADERGVATNPLDAVWLANLEQLRPLAAYASPFWGEVGEPAIRAALGQALTTPNPDLQAILDAAATQAQQALDQRLQQTS